MDWQRLRKPQMTLRVMFALTTLVAVVVWYQTRQRFEVIGELGWKDFAAIRGWVRSSIEFKQEPVVTLRVLGPDRVDAEVIEQVSPTCTHGIRAKLTKRSGKWTVGERSVWSEEEIGHLFEPKGVYFSGGADNQGNMNEPADVASQTRPTASVP